MATNDELVEQCTRGPGQRRRLGISQSPCSAAVIASRAVHIHSASAIMLLVGIASVLTLISLAIAHIQRSVLIAALCMARARLEDGEPARRPRCQYNAMQQERRAKTTQ